MSNVIEVHTKEEFAEALATGDDVVIDFSAPSWCIPCQRLAPHFDKASEMVPGVTFVMVDVDELPEISNAYGVMSVPTVLRFRRGAERETVTGRTVVQLVKELS